ncbi:MFS transporter [Actinoplanes bogorensis]|uniref:MFS transporter n=1 Tax=Paractinoplanes bogorensis TaxID=1610840 RepID=A0ABS5YS91_9ACTN|nr:Cmx/CmrA family chloramphenicol efflux MFS transporter [Actinoplanes bogorensis]MBU2666317.1 MFS transporter [Actinoplanes bogorensis]
MPFSLFVLALAVFAMGTSEFMLAGLLPDIAADLGVSVGAAGSLNSAYALGMLAGAPLMAALARSWPGRRSLLGFVLTFVAAHVAGAVTTSFPVLLVTRVVAAVANAGFLAVALTVAVGLVAAERKGRALAVLLSGTTVATIAGVPAGSVIGTLSGWRATFWSIAALGLLAVAGLTRAMPAPGGSRPDLRTEIGLLGKPRLLLVMVLGALVNAGTFGAFTFLAPVVTGTAGLGEWWVAVVLMLFGAGSLVGVTVAGRLSDRRPGTVVAVGGPLLAGGWVALALLAGHPVALLILVFTQGTLSFALGSTLITRVLYEAAAAPTMAGSYATAALNVGAAAGPLIAAGALGAGNAGPFWVGAGLVTAALIVAALRPRALQARVCSAASVA